MLTDVDRDNSTLVAVSEEMNNFSVVEVALVVNSSTKSLPTQRMTTIALWELSGMLLHKRLRRLSRSWLSVIILTRIVTIRRQQSKSLLRLQMPTRLSLTLRRDKYTMNRVLKVWSKTNNANHKEEVVIISI